MSGTASQQPAGQPAGGCMEASRSRSARRAARPRPARREAPAGVACSPVGRRPRARPRSPPTAAMMPRSASARSSGRRRRAAAERRRARPTGRAQRRTYPAAATAASAAAPRRCAPSGEDRHGERTGVTPPCRSPRIPHAPGGHAVGDADDRDQQRRRRTPPRRAPPRSGWSGRNRSRPAAARRGRHRAARSSPTMAPTRLAATPTFRLANRNGTEAGRRSFQKVCAGVASRSASGRAGADRASAGPSPCRP